LKIVNRRVRKTSHKGPVSGVNLAGKRLFNITERLGFRKTQCPRRRKKQWGPQGHGASPVRLWRERGNTKREREKNNNT